MDKIIHFKELSESAKKVAISNMRDRAEYINMVLKVTRVFARCELDNMGIDTDSMVQFSVGLQCIRDDAKRKGGIDLSINVGCFEKEIDVEIMKILRDLSDDNDSPSDDELACVECVEVAYSASDIVTNLEPRGLIFGDGRILDEWLQTTTLSLFTKLHQRLEEFYNACFMDGMVATYLAGRNPECLSDGRLVG